MLGYGGRDVRTITEGSLTIDVVDHGQSALVWSGTAEGRLTKKALNDPQPAIDQAVVRHLREISEAAARRSQHAAA